MVDANGNLDVHKFKNVYKCDIEQAKKVHVSVYQFNLKEIFLIRSLIS